MSEPLPIACTLDPGALETRRQDLIPGLARRAAERLELADGYRFRFEPADGVVAQIASVIDAERRCCRFLTFRVTVEAGGGPIWLEVDGPAGTRAFLAGLFDA